jgi:hypothetical protein
MHIDGDGGLHIHKIELETLLHFAGDDLAKNPYAIAFESHGPAESAYTYLLAANGHQAVRVEVQGRFVDGQIATMIRADVEAIIKGMGPSKKTVLRFQHGERMIWDTAGMGYPASAGRFPAVSRVIPPPSPAKGTGASLIGLNALYLADLARIAKAIQAAARAEKNRTPAPHCAMSVPSSPLDTLRFDFDTRAGVSWTMAIAPVRL